MEDHRERRVPIPGLGHPIHKRGDPRTAALFRLAREVGFAGRYVTLEERIGAEATALLSRPLPVNVTGAIGAILSEMGFPWSIARGIGVMSRSIGLVGHILEESDTPIAGEIWRRADAEANSS